MLRAFRLSRRRWALAAAMAVLAVSPSHAAAADDQPAPAAGANAPPMELTLAEGIALALTNNRRLIQYRIDRTVQQFALKVAERKFLPIARISSSRRFETEASGTGWTDGNTRVSYQVGLRVPTGGEFRLINSVASLDRRQGEPYGSALTLTFTQPLLRGGGLAVNRASVEVARLREQINVLVFERAIEDVVTAAIRAYRTLIRAQRRLEINTRSLQRTKDLLAINQLLVETGRMAELDIVQTEADVAERELALIGAENTLDAARLALIDILDIDSQTPLHPTDTLNLAAAKSQAAPNLAQSMALALEHRPDYLQAQLRLESAQQELLVAKNNRLWDLSATFSADVNEAGGFADAIGAFRGIDDGRYRVGLELTIPVGDLGPKQRFMSARAVLQRSEYDLAELHQTIDIAVRNAVREVEVRFRQVDLAARARELAERKLEAERGKLRLGLSTNFQMILFEDDLVQAQDNDLNATIAYLNALTALDQTLGTTLRTWGIDVERM